MRYSIMLQIVVGTTLILVAAGAFFGRLQTRPVDDASTSRRPPSCLAPTPLLAEA